MHGSSEEGRGVYQQNKMPERKDGMMRSGAVKVIVKWLRLGFETKCHRVIY